MSVYEIITERLLRRLDEGIVPWRTPWPGGEAGVPRNLQTGYHYRGINVFLLTAAGFSSPYWLTFRQVKQRGGNVRPGEHGTPVVFWKWRYGSEQDVANGRSRRRHAAMHYYLVFNLEQCDSVAAPAPRLVDDAAPGARCEAIIGGVPDAPAIEPGHDQAAYLPARDAITLPARDAFASEDGYYAALFHLLMHATGHPRRLARPGLKKPTCQASQAYSREELITEMGATLLCGHAGIPVAALADQAVYIESWRLVLRRNRRLAVEAATQAHKAVDYILGRTSDPEGEMREAERHR
jgi:antirestriction protein ArdC